MFEFDILGVSDDLEIQVEGKKTIYNTDSRVPLSQWVREPLKGMKTFDVPQMTSATNITDKGSGKVVKDSLGYLMNNSNNINESGTGVSLCSSTFSKAHGLSVHQNNFIRVCLTLSVRKIVNGNWINSKDEYLAPNEQHEHFEQFKYDSLVYSMFNNSSEQSSLRQVTYKGKLWDIKNEFFWMSAERMKELADNNGYDKLYNDARTSPNRHVYNLLFGEERIYDKLSPDAKAVLDKATELVEKSIKMRMIMSNDENHLDSWDAGYTQLKLVWKEYFSEDFKEFRQLYKNMEDRMRPLVYELGFLMK
jgi:hypothetical protein